MASEKGKERFSVVVTVNPVFDRSGGNSVEGAQFSSSSRPGVFPLLSKVAKAKQNAMKGVKASVNASLAGASGAAVVGGVSLFFAVGVGVVVGVVGVVVGSVFFLCLCRGLCLHRCCLFASASVLRLRRASHRSDPARRWRPSDGLRVLLGRDRGRPRRGHLLLAVGRRPVRRRQRREGDARLQAPHARRRRQSRRLGAARARRRFFKGRAEDRGSLALGRGAALDAGTGVYLVSVSFPALLPGAPLPLPATKLRAQLMNAVNDVDPADPCTSLAERTGFDVCNAIDDATHLARLGGEARLVVDSAPGDTDAAGGGVAQLFLPFARRSKSSEAACDQGAFAEYSAATGAVSAS